MVTVGSILCADCIRNAGTHDTNDLKHVISIHVIVAGALENYERNSKIKVAAASKFPNSLDQPFHQQ